MSNQISAPGNTGSIRRSNRDNRLLRQKRAHRVLLAICWVLLALLLVSTVFLFCHTAYILSDSESKQVSEAETVS